MKSVFCRNLLFAAFALAATVPAVAHHSYSMFDMEKNVTYKGTVLEYKWTNPHVHLIVDVRPGDGIDPESVGTWDLEGASTNIMGRQGWTRSTFKAGDAITAVARPLKDGAKGAALYYVTLADGRRLYMDIARPKDAS